jgi:hypothetical protein
MLLENGSIREWDRLEVQGPVQDMVMIGTVPCKIVSKVHVDGCHVAQSNTRISGNAGRHANPEEDESSG